MDSPLRSWYLAAVLGGVAVVGMLAMAVQHSREVGALTREIERLKLVSGGPVPCDEWAGLDSTVVAIGTTTVAMMVGLVVMCAHLQGVSVRRYLYKIDLPRVNMELAQASARRKIEWAVETFGNEVVLLTSFGVQSAVMLHLATQVKPDIKVLWIDTGYLPPETYRFAAALQRRLNLNLHVYQSGCTPARMEALHGKLWEKGEDQARLYGILRKVEPMQKAMKELGGKCLLSGVRAGQTEHRKQLQSVEFLEARAYYKCHPVIDWAEEDVDAYIAKHSLPYHPLKKKGYATVGDAHSSRPKKEGEDARKTRFGGKRQECGIHTEQQSEAEIQDIVRDLSSAGQPSTLPKSPNRPKSPKSLPLPKLANVLLIRSKSWGNLSMESMEAPSEGSDGSNDEDNPQTAAKAYETNAGFEVYGSRACRFCKAAKDLLRQYRPSEPMHWVTVQRYNLELDRLEPPGQCVGDGCVTVPELQDRIERVAPGEERFETVPQIFHNGKFVGGFVDLCMHLGIDERVADLFLGKQHTNKDDHGNTASILRLRAKSAERTTTTGTPAASSDIGSPSSKGIASPRRDA